ncbi:sigmaY antisigma factor component [Paenibacillus marinisediminis]
MNTEHTLHDIPLWLWTTIIAALLIQGTWIFLHARKNGHFPWLWALWGFINVPTPGLLYLLFVAKPWRKRQ